MSLALRVLAALFICLSVVPLAHAQQRAEEVRFTHAGVQADAKRYETYLKANWQPGRAAARSCEPRATACSPPAPTRAQQRAPMRRPSCSTPTTRRPGPDSPARCSPSSPTRARSATTFPSTPRAPPGTPTSAARLLPSRRRRWWCCTDALKRRSYWRPAIDALKSSLSLADDAQVREAYDALVARARLPHRRVQGRCRLGPAAAVHPVLRAAGAGPGRLGEVPQGRRQGPAGRDGGGAPDLPRRPRPRQALRGAGARRPALGDRRRDARQDGRARRLRQGPQLRPCARRAAAMCCPTAASRASRWSRSTPTRSTSRSTASATAALPRPCRAATSPEQVSSYDISQPEGAHRRPRLCRRAGRHLAPQRGRDDRLPDRRGDPQAAARRLRAGGLRRRPRRTRTTATAARHAVVHRLRPRPHRHQRRRRPARVRALARRPPRRS